MGSSAGSDNCIGGGVITPNSRSSKETSTRLWLGLGEVGLLEGKIRCQELQDAERREGHP
jgi:hypothetical protein